MSKYMVTYDLRKPGQNYDNLIAAIKSYGGWVKVSESSWFIRTNSTAAEVRDKLNAHTDSGDRLMVAGLSGEAAWRNCIATNDELTNFFNNN